MYFKNKFVIANKIWSMLTHREQRNAIVLLVLMLIGMMLETLGVSLVIPALALLTQGDISLRYPEFQPVIAALGNPSQQTLVIGGMVLLVSVYFIKAIFLALLAWWQMRFAFGVQAQLSQRLFEVYLRQPYTFHLQRNSAQLIRNVINEVSMITGNAILPVIMLLTEGLVLISLCGLLLAVEPQGALIVVSVLGVAAWVFHLLTHGRIQRWGKARQYHEGLRLQHLQQGLGGAKDVKIFGREADFLQQYRIHNDLSAHVAQMQSIFQQLPRLWLELLAVSGLAILVISMLAQNRPLESVLPTLGLFAAAAFRLMPSVSRILGALQALRYGTPMIDVLHAELNLKIPDATGDQKPFVPFHSSMELNYVSYTYPSAASAALKDISLLIKRGESIGFIGSSGAGKSTLVDNILGLLTPDLGEVRVDGKVIQQNLRNWQDQIGYVPQSIYLTDDTLLRNVAFGLPNEQIDEAAVKRAIHLAQLDDFVSSLPNGLMTMVGERGIRLSGGQRQRIGIARALYHDPAVLLLDEATSSLDTETEYGVMQAVKALKGNKTILIVAHRLSTVEHCDRLYRIEKGVLVDTVGTIGTVDNAI
jgi:ABC-type multidrug transport system fused ATPase/permease subunit